MFLILLHWRLDVTIVVSIARTVLEQSPALRHPSSVSTTDFDLPTELYGSCPATRWDQQGPYWRRPADTGLLSLVDRAYAFSHVTGSAEDTGRHPG
jgi:hypothetical protein